MFGKRGNLSGKDLENKLDFGSTEFYVFRGNPGISDTEFVYYLSRWDDVREHAEINLDGTSGRQRVPKACFDDLVINMPPLPTQTAIASVLSSLDDKIELLHHQNTTLEKIAETLFRQWFVEEAKEEWENNTLSYYADFFNGKTRPIEAGTIPVYGGNGILGYTNKLNYSGKSVIIGRVGAYCGSLYYENKDIWVSDNALLVKSKIVNTEHFLFYLLKTLDLNSMAEGSSHPLLTQTLLKSISLQIPPIEKIYEFERIVEDIQSKIDSSKTQIRALTALRCTLLPKLMNGEVRVAM